MQRHRAFLEIRTRGKGLHEITGHLKRELQQTGMDSGMIYVFCRHTSASLVMMENADPTAQADLEAFFDRLVPEDEPYYKHTLEGPDDMTSHIKMALTRSSETIPFENSEMLLGTWQGIFLWEHRENTHSRKLILDIIGDFSLSY